MKAKYCIWAHVDERIPWAQWWKELRESYGWSDKLEVEKWESNASLPQILDSINSFNLFGHTKAIIVQDADKVLKNELKAGAKELKEIHQKLARGPHFVILHSSKHAPAKWNSEQWACTANPEEEQDNKAAFKWIDAVHAENISQAIYELEKALQGGQHPLALLQLMTRHFRLGRLIQHAHATHLSEKEMTAQLKTPSFVIRKWTNKPKKANSQWQKIFDRLWSADFELKSGQDGAWTMRKLTLDLVQLSQRRSYRNVKIEAFMKPFSREPQLWPAATSFA